MLGTLLRWGHQVLVVTARRNASKSTYDAIIDEKSEGLTILRPYATFPTMVVRPEHGLTQVADAVTAFRPEVVLCSHEGSLRVGLALQSLTGRVLPLVVVTEDAGRLAERGYRGLLANLVLPWIGIPWGPAGWRWAGRHAAAIITCHPRDSDRLGVLSISAGGVPVFYIPWCNPLSEHFVPVASRDPGLAVYIGAFSRHKGTDRLGVLVPALLTRTPTRRIVLVGSGRTGVVERLARAFGDRIDYRPGLSRREALELLAQSAYGISPTGRGGWGFIGDCWAVGTPLVAVSSDYRLKDRVDALVGDDVDGIVSRVDALYRDPTLGPRLASAGRRRHRRYHSAAAVARRYEAVLQAALDGAEVVE